MGNYVVDTHDRILLYLLQGKANSYFSETLIKSYGYLYDEIWRDKLVEFDGNTINYDEIGNPLSDGRFSYTWTQGRRLETIRDNDPEGLRISFKYNDSGIRTQKKVEIGEDTVTTDYHLVGGRVTYETNGEDEIHYTYDSVGDRRLHIKRRRVLLHP
jgi:uncharacterized protein RhaS with RHS repeats